MRKLFRRLTAAGLLIMLVLMAGCETAGEIPQENLEEGIEEAAPEEADGAEDTEDIDADNTETEVEDVTLREAITSESGLGPDAICGTAIGSGYFSDPELMDLVYDHYNALTFENELKPETMFGNSYNGPMGGTHDEELNGETISVPAIYHKKADDMLDKILAWNEENPDRVFKVRGHVLVWHSQTPEWFFREDYDNDKPYVSSEVMDRRQEWYIKSMLEYYTGEDSKYKGLFYAWDVVNEAVSDTGGKYRSADSSWWKVYGSEEYIVNAFKYANKYADPEVDLYYNDYNEDNDLKMMGIIKLIQAVKEDPEARIDGFGMQGHYSLNQPSDKKFETCARKYLEEVDKVMLTELDVKASAAYDGSDEKVKEEYIKQAEYYKGIYDAAKRIKADGGDFAGITTWGVTDPMSWLHEFTHRQQCPLLFDGSYKPKPAFWAFVDPDRIEGNE